MTPATFSRNLLLFSPIWPKTSMARGTKVKLAPLHGIPCLASFCASGYSAFAPGTVAAMARIAACRGWIIMMSTEVASVPRIS
jgi:hypothetical protein